MSRIEELGNSGVVVIGALREDIVGLWTADVSGNCSVVLTGRRRAHYLARHPDMAIWERILLATLLDPDEVHRNREDPRVAIFYRLLYPGRYLRVAVLMQERVGVLRHSVITCQN